MAKTSIEGPNLKIDLDPQGPGKGLTSQEIDSFLEQGRGGFTQGQIDEAFDLVKNEEHWKNPIDTVIPAEKREIVEKAIPWFTGTDAEFTEIDGQPQNLRVTAPGYYAGPCN